MLPAVMKICEDFCLNGSRQLAKREADLDQGRICLRAFCVETSSENLNAFYKELRIYTT